MGNTVVNKDDASTDNLTGQWLYVQYFDDGRKKLEYRETWTFDGNGILEWTEEDVGLGKSSERYRYVVDRNKVTTIAIKSGIIEDMIFNINGEHLSMYDCTIDEAFTLTRVAY